MPSLGLGNPLLAWGLLAAALPLLVHLLFRRRPRPTPFPALDFLLQARRENARRLRLRKLLLFLARTAVLAAVALAIARPQLTRRGAAAAAPVRGPAATAIVLDASASMTYRLRGQALFERARADALEALTGLGPEEPVTALVCGGQAVPRAEPAGFDRAAVRRLLEEAAPGALFADMSACASAAARALSESASASLPGQRLVVATDLTASAWRLDAPAPLVQTPRGAVRPEVTLLDAARGEPLPDLGIAEVVAEPDPAVGPRGFRVTVSLANRGKEPVADLPVVLRTGGPNGPVAVRAFASLPPGGVVKKQLAVSFPAGGPAALHVSIPEDALAYDDARALTLSVPREVRALVVNGAASPVRHKDEAFFVEVALGSPASPVRPTVVDPESLGKVKLADFQVVLLLNVRTLGPVAAELRGFVERGGGLFVAMGDQVDPDRYGEELGALLPRPLHVVKTAAEKGKPGAAERAARFASVDYGHPALSIFAGSAGEGLEGTRTWRYMLLKPAPGGRAEGGDRVLMAFDDGAPALVEARRGRGRVLLFTSTVDREWSDWTIRTSFLPAIQRFAAWLAGALEERRDAPTLVGTPRAIAAGEGQRVVAAVGPDGKERKLQAPAAGGPPSLLPDRPGLWQVRVVEAGGERLDPALAFAVLPDPREADTTRLEAGELTAWFGGAGHARVAAEAESKGDRPLPLWSLLLAAGVALFLAEGILLA